MSTKRAVTELPLMLTIDDIKTLMRCGRTAAYAYTREPDFPTPVALSEKAYRWWRHEVLEWLESRRLSVRPTKPRPAAPAPVTALVDDTDLPAPTPVVRRGRAA